MTTRLIILLAAALLCWAAPAAGQTIKSLGFNTTNGVVVYTGTNALTFTNALQFATNARAETRTNLGGTTVGNALFTAFNANDARNALGATVVGGNIFTVPLQYQELYLRINADNTVSSLSASNFRTAIGLGVSSSVEFSNVYASALTEVRTLFVNDSTNQVRVQFEEPANAKTFVRNLTGNTNTNAPFSGEFRFEDPDTATTYVATVSNGIILFINEF
jgi:hypothetical protein